MAEYLTITNAAKQKGCTRVTIYKWLKQGKIKKYEVAGKKFVVNDESFVQAKSKAEEEMSRVERLEERVEKIEKALEEVLARLKSMEEKPKNVPVTKARYKQA